MAIAINIAYIFPAIMNFIYSLLISFSLGKCTKISKDYFGETYWFEKIVHFK